MHDQVQEVRRGMSRRYVRWLVLTTIVLNAVLWAHAQARQNMAGLSLGRLDLHNCEG